MIDINLVFVDSLPAKVSPVKLTRVPSVGEHILVPENENEGVHEGTIYYIRRVVHVTSAPNAIVYITRNNDAG